MRGDRACVDWVSGGSALGPAGRVERLEWLVIDVAGAVLGYAGAALIDLAAPRLSAPTGSRIVSAAVSAPVTIGMLMLAVAIAVAGGVLAGALGGWRAARLRPTAAMARPD